MSTVRWASRIANEKVWFGPASDEVMWTHTRSWLGMDPDLVKSADQVTGSHFQDVLGNSHRHFGKGHCDISRVYGRGRYGSQYHGKVGDQGVYTEQTQRGLGPPVFIPTYTILLQQRKDQV